MVGSRWTYPSARFGGHWTVVVLECADGTVRCRATHPRFPHGHESSGPIDEFLAKHTPEAVLTLPTVHLNGSGRQRLLDINQAALAAIDAALEALHEAAPHGRDYYVNPDPEAYSKAAVEHGARIDTLTKVRQDCETLIQHVYEARR